MTKAKTAAEAVAAIVQPTDRAVPAAAPTRPWLTTAPSEAFGPTGRILHLTEEASAAAPKGLLAVPTAEQLARLQPL